MLFFIRAHTNQQSGIPRAIEFGTRVAAPSVLEHARGDAKGTTLVRWYRSSEEGFLEGSVTSSERSLPLKEDYRKGTTVSSTNKKKQKRKPRRLFSPHEKEAQEQTFKRIPTTDPGMFKLPVRKTG